jgi:hypothetical protein
MTALLLPGPIKYQPEEILQIIQANYKQQQQFDPIALKNGNLTFSTTIFDWRDTCDLVETNQLWQHLNFYFRLNIEKNAWMTVLDPEDDKTLKDLCKFIAYHANKPVITPIKLFDKDCLTASIFRTIKQKLQERGIDTTDIRPTSVLEPLWQKWGSTFAEEINLVSPNVLPPIDYKANWLHRWGLNLIIIFTVITCFFLYKESRWGWLTGGIIPIGITGVSFKQCLAVGGDICSKLLRGRDYPRRPGRPTPVTSEQGRQIMQFIVGFYQ